MYTYIPPPRITKKKEKNHTTTILLNPNQIVNKLNKTKQTKKNN